MYTEIEQRASSHLESEDYCPNQTQCNLVVSINNVMCTNVFQMDLKGKFVTVIGN